MVLALDGQDDLVEMPLVAAPQLSPTQLVGISLAELQRPLPNRFVRHDDASTGYQFLGIKTTQRKREIQPNNVADDLGRVAEAAVELSICHPASLQIRSPAVSLHYSSGGSALADDEP